jgi:hypothetical protein
MLVVQNGNEIEALRVLGCYAWRPMEGPKPLMKVTATSARMAAVMATTIIVSPLVAAATLRAQFTERTDRFEYLFDPM